MSFFRELVEIFFSIALFINALLFIPQLVKLWQSKKTEGLSVLMFVGFSILQVLAILHGYFKKDYILLAGFGLSLISCGSIAVLLIVYKIRKIKKK